MSTETKIPELTFREGFALRILLLVAKYFAPAAIQPEVKDLITHLNVYGSR